MINMLLMLLIVVGLFGLGDFLGVLTKAKLSSVFVALLGALILFMTGTIPADIVAQAGLSDIAKWASPILVFSMGTMINIKQLFDEWRTVLMSLIAMMVALVSLMLVSPIIGKELALVSIPIVNGGIIATEIMTTAALEKGFPFAAGFGALVYAIQKFVGTVPASYFGLKEANIIVTEYRKNSISITELKKEATTQEATVKQAVYKKYISYYTPFVCFALATLGGLIAVIIQKYTGLHNSITSLILGAIVGYMGLVPPNILDHGKSSGLITMVVFAAIIPSLAKITFGDLVTMSWLLVVIFGVVLLGTYFFICVLPTWKLVGSKNLAFGIAMGQLLGFPATYLIANEIATAVSENDEEYKVIMAKLGPAYVVSGMASVTTLSVFIAGFLVNFL